MMRYVISAIVIAMGTTGSAAAAGFAGGAEGCTESNGDSCEFNCVAGAVIVVSASSTNGGRATVSGSCGGASASCSGAGSCTSESNPTAASDTGVCAGDDGGESEQTYSCASSVGSEALAALLTDGNVLALATPRVEPLP